MAAKAKSKRPPQKRGELTKLALVQATIKALRTTSIHGLRISQVAKEAGVPQSLVDYHFPSLEDLLFAVVVFGLQKLKEESIRSIEVHTSDPRKALEAYIRVPFDLGKKDAGFRAVWTVYLHMSAADQRFADLFKNVREVGQDRIINLIHSILTRECRRVNHPGSTTAIVAGAIQGMISGCGSMAAAEGSREYDKYADISVSAAMTLVEAYFPV